MTGDRELPVPTAALRALDAVVAEELHMRLSPEEYANVARSIARPVVAAVLTDSVAFVERAIREERDRLPDDRYDSHEAYEVCSGHLLGLLKLYAGGEAAVEALRAAEEERQP